MCEGWFRSKLGSSGIDDSNRGLDFSVQSGDRTHFNFFLDERTQGFSRHKKCRQHLGYRLFVSHISWLGRHDDSGTNKSIVDSSAAMASMIYGVQRIGCVSDFGFADDVGSFQKGLVPSVGIMLRCAAPGRHVAG